MSISMSFNGSRSNGKKIHNKCNPLLNIVTDISKFYSSYFIKLTPDKFITVGCYFVFNR